VVSKGAPSPRVASQRCEFSDGWSQLQLGRFPSPGARSGSHTPLSHGVKMERVLLLNATYEPLALVSDRRAVVLVLAGRAEPVAFRDDCAVFHSASLDVDVPSIVRLAHMVRIPRWARTPPVTRRSVLRRDGGICVYCSEPADTIDHVIPRSRGGTHDWSNVVAACKRDNLTKADLLLSELGWTLRVKPAPPDGYLWRLRHLSDVDPLWEPYLAAAS
jgi:5-methylcytosine-specific restriction endonuclease McrA